MQETGLKYVIVTNPESGKERRMLPIKEVFVVQPEQPTA